MSVVVMMRIVVILKEEQEQQQILRQVLFLLLLQVLVQVLVLFKILQRVRRQQQQQLQVFHPHHQHSPLLARQEGWLARSGQGHGGRRRGSRAGASWCARRSSRARRACCS